MSLLLPLSGIALEYSGLDIFLVRPFYDGSLHRWPYKPHWLASDILHTGGRDFVVAVAVIIFLFFILSFFVKGLKSYRNGAEIGHAFPAVHSSGGFAFFSLYFLALAYKPSFRYAGLFFALLLGFTFGIAQQARGAHFLSHDFFSLAVCWYCALITYFIFFKGHPFMTDAGSQGTKTGEAQGAGG